MSRSGKVVSIELSSYKEKNPDSKFLKRINFPVYSAVVKMENGSSGSSAYFLVDGKLKWFRGLRNFDQELEHLKSENKNKDRAE